MTPYQFFKALDHHWGDCNWQVVTENGDVGFLGQGDNDGRLQAGWDKGLGEGPVENPVEDSSQLVRVVLQHTSIDAVRSSTFLGFTGRSVHVTSRSSTVRVRLPWATG